jgi:hypothetical protein
MLQERPEDQSKSVPDPKQISPIPSGTPLPAIEAQGDDREANTQSEKNPNPGDNKIAKPAHVADDLSAQTDNLDFANATLPSLERSLTNILPAPTSYTEAGLTAEEVALLNSKLPNDLAPDAMEKLWSEYQETIGQLLLRMGRENSLGDSVLRVPWIKDMQGIYTRLALIPKIGKSALHNLESHGVSDFFTRIAGECSMMELSAAAGYRTFCLPDLVKGLLKSAKMRDKSFTRMFDTFEFLNTMMQYPMNHPKTLEQLERTNGLHKRYKVAGAFTEAERDLFKYIGLNMFYIGPSMRQDLTPKERHALCGLTVLVSSRMGHKIDASVKELEEFIPRYEDTHMFSRDDKSVLHRRAVEIAKASQKALDKIPIVSRARIHSYVPYKVKMILDLE